MSYENTRPPLGPGILTPPAGFFTDPSQFAREMEKIFARMWLGAARNDELPAPGHYVVRRVAGANVVLLRGEDGRPAAFHNVCRHRGTLLLTQESGRLDGSIRCPYHAWTYGLDGRLRGAPHMDKVEGFRTADFPLRAVASGEWEGHLLINLAEPPPPLAEHVAGLTGRFAPWRMGELRRVERRQYAVKANWKLILQNYSECLHCPGAHPQLTPLSHYLSGENEPAQPTWIGGRMELREGVETLRLGVTTGWGARPGLSAEQRRNVYYYAVLPNLLLNIHPDYLVTTTLWPRAADRTDLICDWHFASEAIGKSGFDPAGAVDFWDLTNRQDWELCERAQEGIASRGYRPGPYSNREEQLFAIDQFVRNRLQTQ